MTEPVPTGTHLIADLFGCSGLADMAVVEDALRRAVTAAGATLLDLKLHGFGDSMGITGVALLAESHISIHTWPEHGYAALDIFLCGERHHLSGALATLTQAFDASRCEQRRLMRGFGALATSPCFREDGSPEAVDNMA